MDKIQIIKCKCGEVFAACQEPECWTEKDWQKDIRKYVGEGCSVETVDRGTWSFGSCKCENESVQIIPTDKTQLALNI